MCVCVCVWPRLCSDRCAGSVAMRRPMQGAHLDPTWPHAEGDDVRSHHRGRDGAHDCGSDKVTQPLDDVHAPAGQLLPGVRRPMLKFGRTRELFRPNLVEIQALVGPNRATLSQIRPNFERYPAILA